MLFGKVLRDAGWTPLPKHLIQEKIQKAKTLGMKRLLYLKNSKQNNLEFFAVD